MGIELSDWLKIFGSVIVTVVWSIRLEGRVNYLEKYQAKTDSEVEKLDVRVQDIDSQVVKELSQIKEAVARIEGRLSVKES